MPNYLDDKIAPIRKSGKFPTAVGVFDKASGLIKDLRLEQIRVNNERRFTSEARADEMRTSAASIAIKLNAHQNTLASARAQNAAAMAALASKTFPRPSDTVDAMWQMRIFDHIADMPAGAALKALAADPRMLAAVINAPIALPNVPGTELTRIVHATLEKANPAAVAEIAAERDALDVAGANLEIAKNAIREAAGFGQDFPRAEQWIARQQPSPESQAALTKEVSAAEADRLIALIKGWDFDDRRVVLDRIMEVQEIDVLGHTVPAAA
jgi:hypothetical protein